MQRVTNPIYTYDALGRLVNYTPSGATNDVVAQHVMLDPRIPGPRSLISGGLHPVVGENSSDMTGSTPVATVGIPATTVGNATLLQGSFNASVDRNLYVPPLSMTSPPVSRPKTEASILGHASFQHTPEIHDIYAITSASPILDVPHDTGSKRSIR